MLMALIPQSKAIEQQIRLRKKTQPFLAYKKHISLRKTNTDLRMKKWKNIFQASGSKTGRSSYYDI
jgi:hypothetical protein